MRDVNCLRRKFHLICQRQESAARDWSGMSRDLSTRSRSTQRGTPTGTVAGEYYTSLICQHDVVILGINRNTLTILQVN